MASRVEESYPGLARDRRTRGLAVGRRADARCIPRRRRRHQARGKLVDQGDLVLSKDPPHHVQMPAPVPKSVLVGLLEPDLRADSQMHKLLQ